jgi:hypothetical protein
MSSYPDHGPICNRCVHKKNALTTWTDLPEFELNIKKMQTLYDNTEILM